MPRLHHHLLLLLLLPFLAASLPADPEPIQPALVLPTGTASSSPPATIPAFPEQSAAASSCPLDLSDDLLRAVSHSCSSSSGLPSRSRCCPALAAWLFSAYSATALSGGAARSIPASAADLPVLPDDSESCVSAAEEALRARGAALPRVNASCGVAYCYCGVRLRRLACPGPFVPSGDGGEWAPRPEYARRLEHDCARSGLAGCSRCLASLNQLKSDLGGNLTGSGKKQQQQQQHKPQDKECQLMGLTWLLSKNRTLYLPTATAVLRAFPAATAVCSSSCNLPSDDFPLAVGSDQIDDSSAAGLSTFSFSFFMLVSSTLLLCSVL